jgi:hypothetical protein
MILHKILSSILINAFILYLVVKYLKIGFVIEPMNGLNCEVVLMLGAIFWLIYDIGVRLVRLLAFPFSLILGNIFVLFLNIVAIYIFVYVINSLDLGVQLKVISL